MATEHENLNSGKTPPGVEFSRAETGSPPDAGTPPSGTNSASLLLILIIGLFIATDIILGVITLVAILDFKQLVEIRIILVALLGLLVFDMQISILVMKLRKWAVQICLILSVLCLVYFVIIFMLWGIVGITIRGLLLWVALRKDWDKFE